MGIAAALVLGLASAAQAQQRVFRHASAGPTVQTMHSLPGVVIRAGGNGSPSSGRTVRVITTQATTPTTATVANGLVATGTSSLSVQGLLNPVPGLGFDFTHLAVINQDLDIKALIDPITQGRLAVAERLLRETPQVPFFFPVFGTSTPIILEQQPPQVVIVQQAPAATPATSERAVETEVAAPPTVPSVPLPDVGQFTLVLNNGSQISAVAFTRRNDRIIFITPDGKRRSIAVLDLDSATTERVNEERGTSLQLPL